MRSTEWLIYLAAMHCSYYSVVAINGWLTFHDCRLQLKLKPDGSLDKPQFHGGYQCKLWFAPDNIQPEKKMWEAFVEYMEPTADRRGALHNVWRTYDILRDLMSTQLPTIAERDQIGPLTFQHFLAFRRIYAVRHVHLYSHLYFAHATPMMQTLGSVGLFRNESEENVNSEHKRYVDHHSTKGGLGRSMTQEVMQYSQRKLYRALDTAGLDVDEEELEGLAKVTWPEYCARAQAGEGGSADA